MDYIEKLRDNFDEMVVYKDLKKTNFFTALSLPAFMRDWLLRKFEDEDGQFDQDELSNFVKKFILNQLEIKKNNIYTLFASQFQEQVQVS